MDNFEELAIPAGYSGALVLVTKYHSGLHPWINIAITTSRTAPDLTDYNGWRVRTFRQYKVFGCVRTGNPPACLPTALLRPRAVGVFPALAPACAPVSFAPAPVPVLPAVVPMDVEWTRTHAFPRTCFQ